MAQPSTTPPEGLWNYENITPDLIQAERVNKVLFRGSTAFQDVQIADNACFGRSLMLDGKTQSTEVDEFVYHEALVHPPMLAHPNPTNVFIAGGGEGATAREVLAHRSVARCVMVDIDREVVDLCRRYLPNHHRGAFEDPRLELHHADALAFLEGTQDRFDVAIIDVPDPLEGGPAYALFTREFYSLLAKRLSPDGLMVAQSGPTGPAFYEQCFSAVAKTVSSVFPCVAFCEAFIPSFASTWGFVIGSMGPDPASLSTARIDALVAERLTAPLRFYDGTTHQGIFSVPKFLREAVANESRIITKANPLFVV